MKNPEAFVHLYMQVEAFSCPHFDFFWSKPDDDKAQWTQEVTTELLVDMSDLNHHNNGWWWKLFMQQITHLARLWIKVTVVGNHRVIPS